MVALSSSLNLAHNMIQLYGLQAQAMALQYLRQHRQAGDTAGAERWQAVYAAICVLRQSGAKALAA